MCEPLQLIPAANPAWDEYLDRTRHDFHHGAAYHRFLEGQGCGEARLAVVGSPDRFLAWPCLVRTIDSGFASPDTPLLDITSSDGYAGPLAFGCEPGDPFLLRAWQTLVECWRAAGVVSAFSRFHPLLDNHRWVSGLPLSTLDGASDAAAIKLEGHTVSIDLSLSDEQAWSQYRDTHRRHINRGRRLGLVSQTDGAFEYLDAFVRLYNNTMRHNHAADGYFHDLRYMEMLRLSLGPAASLHVTRLGTRVAAAALVSEYRGIVQYIYGGVESELYSVSPLKSLLEHVRQWSRSRGDSVLHLGGGRGAREDSLFYFKAGFSGRRHPFYTGRWILNQELYRRLSEEHRTQGREVRKIFDGNFFPAYRAPFVEPVEENVPLLSAVTD